MQQHLRTTHDYAYSTNNNIVQLITRHIERASPRKFKRKTGQIIKLLSQNPAGLSRSELLIFFCQNFDSASFTRRESLRMSVEKIIQRSRQAFAEYNLTILYNKISRKYVLDLVHKDKFTHRRL